MENIHLVIRIETVVDQQLSREEKNVPLGKFARWYIRELYPDFLIEFKITKSLEISWRLFKADGSTLVTSGTNQLEAVKSQASTDHTYYVLEI